MSNHYRLKKDYFNAMYDKQMRISITRTTVSKEKSILAHSSTTSLHTCKTKGITCFSVKMCFSQVTEWDMCKPSRTWISDSLNKVFYKGCALVTMRPEEWNGKTLSRKKLSNKRKIRWGWAENATEPPCQPRAPFYAVFFPPKRERDSAEINSSTEITITYKSFVSPWVN